MRYQGDNIKSMMSSCKYIYKFQKYIKDVICVQKLKLVLAFKNKKINICSKNNKKAW